MRVTVIYKLSVDARSSQQHEVEFTGSKDHVSKCVGEFVIFNQPINVIAVREESK